MVGLAILFLILVVIGALFGGEGFFGAFIKGLSVIFWIVVLLVGLAILTGGQV